MEDRKCENCAHAHPFGGENDNRCDAWECEYIDRKEAIEAYKARRDIVRCGECKYRYMDKSVWLCVYGLMIKPNGFCNYGERRADENSDMDNSDNRTN